MSEGTAPIRVLLADDQALVRSGFALMLSVEEDIDVVGQAANGREAVELAAALDPDVILMDVQMPMLDGIRATAEIVEAGLGKVVILTTFERDDYLFDSLRAGASGFLLKNADPDTLVAAVHAAATGHALLAPEMTVRVIERFARTPEEYRPGNQGAGDVGTSGTPAAPVPAAPVPAATTPDASRRVPNDRARDRDRDRALARLTEREREVLLQLATGHSNGEIAADLFLGETTVKTHVSNLLAKLGLRDRVQAVVFAYRAGLIRTEEG